MKRLLLTILSVIAFAGITVAQDVIYSSGNYTTPSGRQGAGIYVNGTFAISLGEPSTGYYHQSADVDVYDGDIYWVLNSYNSDGSFNFADVIKNSLTYLSSHNGDGNHIYDLCRSPQLYHNLISVGCKPIDGVKKAVYWRNGEYTPTQLGTGNYQSEAFGATAICLDPAMMVELLFICGYQYTNSSTFHGVIWNGTNVFHNFDNGTKILGITFYDGYLYSVGSAVEGSATKLKVWKTDINDGATTEVYTLASAHSSDVSRTNIFIDDAGDIYVNGVENSFDRIWKNGEPYFTTEHYYTSVWANSNSVYWSGSNYNGVGTIWKDGQELYTPSNSLMMTNLFINEPECESTETRSLPFFEGFETGASDWTCWTKVDEGNNAGYVSKWNRCGKRVQSNIPTGNYCARHKYNGSISQEGWLISPRLFLQPGRDNTKLTFKSYEEYPNDYGYEGVWISTSSNSTSDFTQVWTQSSPSSSWKDVEIDLNEYQGEGIYIAFKYTGTNAHSWLIDDVSVTEEWSPCNTFTAPFTETFNDGNEPGDCWCVFDYDMSGYGKHWKYDETLRCVEHNGDPYPQYGCLVTPNINLVAGHNYVLKFSSTTVLSADPNPILNHKIYYKLDGPGTPNPNNYTSLLWNETDFSYQPDVEIPLSSFAGHTISFSFEYQGTYHSWRIDNVRVEEVGATQYTITANANNNAWGTVTGGGTYNSGATCTLTATPASGYEFLKWTKNGAVVSTNPSYSFTVTENASYTAVFGEPSVNYYTIATNVSPAGAGTVEGAGVYPQGATTYLTATPNMGWTFSHWNDGITTNPRSITVNGDATYTAHFLQQNYTITVAADPPQGGTVSGGGSYHYGDVATLTANANSGYQFQAWSDGSTQNPHPVTVTGNADYIAIFSEVGTTYYNVSANVRPDNAGSVAGTGAYPAGTTITLTATANPGYTFSHWNDGITSNPRTVTVNSNLSFTANFLANTYTITVDANPSNGGTVTGGGSYHYGEIATLRATPNSGFTFVGWNDGSTELTHNVTVTGNATYTATFSQGTVTYYSVNLVCNSSEGSVEGGGFYPAGSTITIQAIPNEGYFFQKWSDESTRNPRQITVNSNITLAAFFKGTGVDEGELNPMTLYPNPAMESIHILGIEANSTIEIYNSLGMLVKVVNAGPDQEIGVSDLASGLYLVRCGNRILRFIKQQ